MMTSHVGIVIGINKNLKPDIVGEITKLPFTNNSFDAILCCQVLEHLPFERVETALKEMTRISNYMVISLPYFSVYISITLDANVFSWIKRKRFKPKNFLMRLPFPLPHKFDGAHYWEIGKRGYPLKVIRKLFQKCGLKILKEKIPPLNAPHHFLFYKERT